MFPTKGYIKSEKVICIKNESEKISMKKALLFLTVLASFMLQAEVKICAHCGKGSRYMRYSAENRHFCSDRCAKAKFSCFSCGNIPSGRYMIIMGTTGESRRYCNACSQYPKCFSCLYPAGRRKTLYDGRVQCFNCSSKVLSHADMQTLLSQLRYDLQEMHNFDPRHRIVMRLVSKNALRKVSGDPNAMGCMKVLVTTKEKFKGRKKQVSKEWNCTLYLMDNLPRTIAAKVIVHELTHDHIFHHAGSGKNPRVTEGICEAVSGQWLLLNKHKGFFEALKKNPDPVYGAGFREMYPQLERYGMRGILERYRSMFTAF